MKSINKQILLLAFLLFTGLSSLLAQGPPPGGGPGRGPGGGRGPGFDPDEMIKREKQNVYKAITDLSDDQKLLLDGIYDEFSLSFKELREEMRETRDFQAMRPKMEALQAEKNELFGDVLNEDQYAIYLNLVEERKKQRANRPQNNGKDHQTQEDNIDESTENPE